MSSSELLDSHIHLVLLANFFPLQKYAETSGRKLIGRIVPIPSPKLVDLLLTPKWTFYHTSTEKSGLMNMSTILIKNCEDLTTILDNSPHKRWISHPQNCHQIWSSSEISTFILNNPCYQHEVILHCSRSYHASFDNSGPLSLAELYPPKLLYQHERSRI